MKKLLILMAILLILVGCGRREEEKRSRPGFENTTVNNDHDIILIHYQENPENYKRSVYVVHAEGLTAEDWTTEFIVRIVKDESEDAVSTLRSGESKWILIFPSVEIAREMLK